ncbi:MAG: hypothetical protein GEU82_10830 [Luteitalea sp.]|nr:hypothetical protein [Luteitalea sp.]
MAEVAEYSFGGGGTVQVFADKGRAGKASMIMIVDNLDERLKNLKAAGIEASAPNRAETVDTAIVNDPDGNQIVFAEPK